MLDNKEGEIIDEIISELSKHISTSRCRETYSHMIAPARTFTVCKLSSEIKNELINKLYYILKEYLGNFGEIELLGNKIHIKLAEERDFWYRLGLALSDGSVLCKSRIIFSVSTPCTLRAIISAFGETKLYLGRAMISHSSGKVILSFNVVAADEGVADLMQLLKLCSTTRGCQTLKDIVNELRSQRDRLAIFLAGAIDGDGAISNFDVRLSVSTKDPLYNIISSVFTRDEINYDRKRYILRISTNALRIRGILKALTESVTCTHKKRKLTELYLKKYSRFRIRGLTLSMKSINDIATSLRQDSLVKMALQSARVRRRGKYKYFVIPISRRTLNTRKKAIISLLKALSKELGLDLLPALKVKTRELIIYNQDIVSLLETLKILITESGDGG